MSEVHERNEQKETHDCRKKKNCYTKCSFIIEYKCDYGMVGLYTNLQSCDLRA